MTAKIESPYSYPERKLLYGGGGAGKTNVVLNIARHIAHGEMHVLDGDYSDPYTRALETEYSDCADRVHHDVMEDDWTPFTEQLAAMITRADQKHDWLVIDPIGPMTWDMVQDWYIGVIYGEDVAQHLVALREKHSDADDLKGYHADIMEHMNWSVIKKEYGKRLWNVLRKWHGHLIITAEAKEISKQDKDDEKLLYGPIGFKPAGERRMMHVAATNLFLDHPSHNRWRITTVKDRNREAVDKMDVENFALDYLVGIAGWQPVRRKR